MTDHHDHHAGGDRRGTNGWSRYEEMVLSELRRLCGDLEIVANKLEDVRTKDLPQIRVDVATDSARFKSEMRANARLWAIVAGAVPIVLGVVYVLVGKGP